jgi:hypothetical protein
MPAVHRRHIDDENHQSRGLLKSKNKMRCPKVEMTKVRRSQKRDMRKNFVSCSSGYLSRVAGMGVAL